MPTRYDPRSRLTGSPHDSIVAFWGRRSIVGSLYVQRGTVQVNSGGTSGTATITAVDLNNARLRYLGTSSAGGGTTEATMMMKAALTNSTTITGTVNSAAGTNTVISYEVTSYVPGIIKSVQRGNMAGNTTATITTLDTSRTELDFLSNTTSGGNTNIADQARVAVTNATTVTSVSLEGVASSINYQAVEWF